MPKNQEETIDKILKLAEALAEMKRQAAAEAAKKPRNNLSSNDITKILWDKFNFVCANDGNIYAEYSDKPGHIVEVREKYSTNPDYIFYLAHDICAENDQYPNRDTLSKGIEHTALAARRHHESNKLPEIPVFTRWGYTHDDNGERTFYYDLANSSNEVIKITKNGPQITKKNLEVIFTHSRHAKKPAPAVELSGNKFNGSMDDLRKITNLDGTNYTLLKGAIFQLFSPRGPYLHILFTGDIAGGKTTLASNIKSILDNREIPLLTMPMKSETFPRIVHNTQVPAFDNVKYIPPDIISIISVASTGKTDEVIRKLFTDKDEVRLNLHKGMIFTTSYHIINSPELLDRFLFIYFRRPEEHHFLPEEILSSYTETIAPSVLGALFNGICESLSNVNAEKEYPSRMNDTLRWVDSASGALGMEKDAFTVAYDEYRTSALIESGLDNIYVTILEQLLLISPDFTCIGTYAGILNDIKHAYANGLIELKTGQYIPRNYRAFVSGLQNYSALLREYGIVYIRDPAGTRSPQITIKFTEARINRLTTEEAQKRNDALRISLTIPLHETSNKFKIQAR